MYKPHLNRWGFFLLKNYQTQTNLNANPAKAGLAQLFFNQVFSLPEKY